MCSKWGVNPTAAAHVYADELLDVRYVRADAERLAEQALNHSVISARPVEGGHKLRSGAPIHRELPEWTSAFQEPRCPRSRCEHGEESQAAQLDGARHPTDGAAETG